jgi:hypothetical protein
LLKRHWRDGLPAPWSYVFAVVCIGIAILIRSSLDWIEGDVPTFAANFPAIVLATLLGGFGPGLVAAILSTLVRGLMLAGHAHGLAHLGDLLHDFNGSVTSDFRPEGLACEIAFDLGDARCEQVELSQVA